MWLFRELLAHIHVVPDNPSSRFKELQTTAHVKNRAKVRNFFADNMIVYVCSYVYIVHEVSLMVVS